MQYRHVKWRHCYYRKSKTSRLMGTPGDFGNSDRKLAFPVLRSTSELLLQESMEPKLVFEPPPRNLTYLGTYWNGALRCWEHLIKKKSSTG
jgi:hypothetical protein